MAERKEQDPNTDPTWEEKASGMHPLHPHAALLAKTKQRLEGSLQVKDIPLSSRFIHRHSLSQTCSPGASQGLNRERLGTESMFTPGQAGTHGEGADVTGKPEISSFLWQRQSQGETGGTQLYTLLF